MRRIDDVREVIAGLTHDERIELARWLVDQLPECQAALDERRPTLVDVRRNVLINPVLGAEP